MLVAESRRGRRLVGRIDRGVDLVAALVDLCRTRGVRSGELRAWGTLETASLRHFDARTTTWLEARLHAGPFTLLSLGGTVAELNGAPHVELAATLARHGDNGVEVIGGMMVAAAVHSIEFVVEEMADIVLRRSIDDRTGLLVISGVTSAEPAAAAASAASTVENNADPAPPPPPAGWSDVIAASQQKPPEAVLSSEQLRVGDVIDHNRFGRCVVDRLEGDGEIAHVRLKNGRLVRLSLDVLDLSRTSDEDGRRVFKNIVAPTRM